MPEVARSNAVVCVTDRPLTSEARRLLDRWLHDAGLLGATGYASVCLYPGGAKPDKKEVAGCLGSLLKTLEYAQPRIVVCLGDVPARALGGYKGSVGSMVGRWRLREPNRLLVVLKSPEEALAKLGQTTFGDLETQYKEILRGVRERLDGNADPPRYDYVEDIRVWATGAISGMAVDVETTVVGKDPDARKDIPTEVAVYGGGVTTVYRPPPSSWQTPGEITVWNAQYDLPLLMRLGADLHKTKVVDLMMAAFHLGEPMALKPCARKVLGVNAMEFGENPHDDSWDNYVAQDPVLTWDLREPLLRRLATDPAHWVFEHVDTPLQNILARGQLRGLRLDQGRVRSLYDRMVPRAAELRRQLVALSGRPDFNPKSPDQCQWLLYDQVGLPVDRRNGRTTDEKAINKYLDVEEVRLLLAYRTASRWVSAYLAKYLGRETISGAYNIISTSRLAQSDWNLMNLPGAIKKCVRAREGKVLIYGDYSQVEVRLAYYFSRDPYLEDVLMRGRDMHTERCKATYGIVTPELRTKAKSANFAALYLGGAGVQAATLGVPRKVVDRAPLPVDVFFAWAERQLYNDDIRTLGGHKFNFEDGDSADQRIREKAKKERVNYPIQGSGGEFTKHAEVIADPWMQQLGGEVIHQEHDSVLAEVDANCEREGIEALTLAMRRAIPDEVARVIPIPAKVISGSHWG